MGSLNFKFTAGVIQTEDYANPFSRELSSFMMDN